MPNPDIATVSACACFEKHCGSKAAKKGGYYRNTSEIALTGDFNGASVPVADGGVLLRIECRPDHAERTATAAVLSASLEHSLPEQLFSVSLLAVPVAP